jgi:very-short-patch-repair endonuclease
MASAFPSIAPLTLTLSPEGRGDVGGGAGKKHNAAEHTELFTSPLRGEVAALRRVRGPRPQPAQIDRARTLRSSMTDAENRLWYHLRNRRLAGFKFVRQLPVAGYYADFACRDAMLIIEADGGRHGNAHDQKRDDALRAEGFTVIRFWNTDILANTDAVLAAILETLSPEGRGNKGALAATAKARSYRLTADIPRLVKE